LITVICSLIIIQDFSYAIYDGGTGLKVDRVEVNCIGVKICDQYIDRWMALEGEYRDLSQLKELIKLMLFQVNVTKFEYHLENDKNQDTVLFISFYVPPIVYEIKIISNISVDVTYFKSILMLKEGGVFNEESYLNNKEIIKNYFKERGYFNANVMAQSIRDNDFNRVTLIYTVEEGSPILIKQIEVTLANKKVQKKILNQLNDLFNQPYDLLKIKLKIDEVEKSMSSNGYLFSQVQEVNFIKQNEKSGKLYIKFDLGERFMFTFLGNKIYSVQELRDYAREQMKKGQKGFNSNQIKKIINDLYEEIGIQNNEIKFDVIRKIDKEDESMVNNYIFNIKEGNKIKIDSVIVIGNKQVDTEKILNLFYKNASILVKRNFYDKKYIYDFRDILNSYYIENGYMYANIDDPEIKFTEGKPQKVNISYTIKEDNQTILDEINISGVPEELIKKILEIMTNKFQTPLNTAIIDQDIKKIIELLKEEGFYYAYLKDNNPEKIVNFSSNLKRAKIIFNFETGDKIYLSKVMVAGNDKTRDKVIKREIELREGDIITPSKIDKIKNDLQGLGIFSQINITILSEGSESNHVNLLVSVQEKDSGYLELAPGYRTDLGVKFSAEVGHRNMQGLNKTISFKGQVNQRTDFSAFDENRKAKAQKKLEYSARTNYILPYTFNYPLTFQTSATGSRKRYFSFDADALQAQFSLSKNFSEKFYSDISYQIEDIVQKDATDVKDNRHLRIGGITPSFTLDLRDNHLSPQR
ncbi:MAG: hypothetical protein HQK51_21875, partial [Oligoflexia bacterium]|nr:hypothetical protein [Oligoflexia bacterium]